VGVGYFDEITPIATGGQSSVTAMEGSTEQQQFHEASPARRKAAAKR
jgi:isocitrate lyase